MRFYICTCFFKKNIFIKKLGQHITFENEEQFRKDYKQVLNKLNEKEERSLFDEMQFEITRRKSFENDSCKRKRIIEESYTKLHWEIYYMNNEYLHRAFDIVLHVAFLIKDRSEIINNLDVLSEDKKIYGFRMFTQKFCRTLLEELDNFEKSPFPKGRPNSMNQYGVLLDELGFDTFISSLRSNFLNDIIKLLYPELCEGSMDSHRAFIVSYKMGQDVDLHEHFDNSEVTLNVCLGKVFTGGELFFGGMKGDDAFATYSQIRHEPGYAILHRGQQLHGALPITDGERYNMIIWMRSSPIRNKKCPMCDKKPDLIPSEGFGDGFTSPSDHDRDLLD